MTNFEQRLRETYESYETPYDSSSWNSIQHQLNAAEAGATGSAASWVAAIAATLFLLASSGIAYYTVIQPKLTTNKARIAQQGEFMDPNDLMRSVIIRDKNGNPVSERSPGQVEMNREVPFTPSEMRNVASADEINTDNSAISESSEIEVSEAQNQTEEPKHEYRTSSSNNELSFAANLREACVGVNVSFELTSEDLDGSYLWNFGDGNFSNKVNPTHIYKKPGTYDVTLSVTSHEDGVIRSKSLKNLIIINPVPEARFDWEYINDTAMAPRVKFLNKSERAKEAAWTLGNSGSNEINPELSLSEAGEYPIKLVVSNEFGCVDSTVKYIDIAEDYRLLAPQTFSPNKDGVNDTFMPEALKLRDVKFELSIYNNNQLVFRSTDKNTPWKGELPGGTLARPGQSFPWVVIMTNENGKEETYSGEISIMP